MVNVPTREEARQILLDRYPYDVITDEIAERARHRLALNLEPFGPETVTDKMLQRLINHENRLDALETVVADLRDRVIVLEGP